MQVILTHEQADFDAVASALGAHILHRGSIMVLPNQLNRNVRGFIESYISELEFTPINNLPKKKIEDVFLVDTQSLVTIKGLDAHTRIHIIDHHDKKDEIPADWDCTFTETGACTTFFVEQIQASDLQLDVIQATLLLLGIHEDTGSLIYTSTTPRDIRAAAFLLENGASLQLASTFLNRPLSKSQRGVLEELIDNVEFLNIENCHILVSFANAMELTDEVSSIAHKLADLYDPDGLFIFVQTPAGVRLVARSTTDQINVAEITRLFGGGGHARAAAALIRPREEESIDLNQILTTFSKDMEMHVQPEIKVRDIMSTKPLIIDPDTSADDAYLLMRQFGYEGYPVVENNSIKGLLIRRSVDRAIAHGMNVSASRLMSPGSFKVFPDDSLRTLQKVMSKSGWGQIPVVDLENQKVVGIVTRTDLLKTMAGKSQNGLDNKNIATEINKQLPKERLIIFEAISIQAEKNQLPIYVVGGFARDMLLNRPSLDLDFVVEGDAIQFAHTLVGEYGGKITSHKKFRTVKWRLTQDSKKRLRNYFSISDLNFKNFPESIDLISARTEFYSKPSALPTIKTSSIKLDLQRRDFTINTMAVRLDGSNFGDLYDYWGGLDDLRNKLIRVLHSLSFVDDPTRMLRAVRFEQRFGFDIEKRTLEHLLEARELLNEVSGDRIRHELDQILLEENVLAILNRMQQLDLFKPIHPSLIWDREIETRISKFMRLKTIDFEELSHNIETSTIQTTGAYFSLLSKLAENSVRDVVKRLRFNAQMKRAILNAHKLLHDLSQLKNERRSEIARYLRKFSPIEIFYVQKLIDDPEVKSILENFSTKWRYVEPLLSGDDLKMIGIEPGPVYSKILDALRDGWLDGSIQNEKEERILLEKILEENPGPIISTDQVQPD